MRSLRPALAIVAVLLAAAGGHPSAGSQTPQMPMFRSTVDLVAVDVQVVGREGAPVAGLGIDDFQVTLNGHPRRLVSVDFVRKSPPLPPDRGGPERPIFTPGTIPRGARVFVLAVDTNSFSVSGLSSAMATVHRLIDQFHPDDVVALYGFPFETPALNFTHDHRALGRALDRLVGQRELFAGKFHLSVSEVIDITANDSDVLMRVTRRSPECLRGNPGEGLDTTCDNAILAEANAQGTFYESQAMRSLSGLNTLLTGLRSVQGRKTVILVSGGLVAGDRTAARPDLSSFMQTVGAQAGAADANLYVLHVDNSFFESFSAANSPTVDAAGRARSFMRDSTALAGGLDMLAGSSGGALLRMQAGTSPWAVDRILRESEAYYLLGVEPSKEDRDGALHFLNVKVKKRGLTIRSRTHVVIPAK